MPPYEIGFCCVQGPAKIMVHPFRNHYMTPRYCLGRRGCGSSHIRSDARRRLPSSRIRANAPPRKDRAYIAVSDWVLGTRTLQYRRPGDRSRASSDNQSELLPMCPNSMIVSIERKHNSLLALRRAVASIASDKLYNCPQFKAYARRRQSSARIRANVRRAASASP